MDGHSEMDWAGRPIRSAGVLSLITHHSIAGGSACRVHWSRGVRGGGRLPPRHREGPQAEPTHGQDGHDYLLPLHLQAEQYVKTFVVSIER